MELPTKVWEKVQVIFLGLSSEPKTYHSFEQQKWTMKHSSHSNIRIFNYTFDPVTLPHINITLHILYIYSTVGISSNNSPPVTNKGIVFTTKISQ